MFRTKTDQTVLTTAAYPQADGSDLILLKYPLLEQTGIVKHCFSTRRGGVSRGVFSTMNLSFSRGDEMCHVRENFRRIAEAMGVSEEDFVFTDQTHTANVKKVTAADAGKGLTRERDYTDIDGLITDEAGIVLSAFFADCVPLYFVDPVHRAIGLSHSGWRGTVLRMGEATVRSMREAYGSRPQDIVCAIGPSICRTCYEVGREVAEEFQRAFAGHENEILFSAGKEDKFLLDLWQANRIVLMNAGVRPEHIAVTNICTCCNGSFLFSHRASMGKRGNLGAFLSLR